MAPILSLSSIRTMTVGPGIAPGLLTPRRTGAARGLRGLAPLPPVGSFAPP